MARSSPRSTSPLRLGLCCTFLEQPIKFRNTTVKANSAMPREQGLARLSELCLTNAAALQAALEYCADHAIGCFRICSQILPLKTHFQCGYTIEELPEGQRVREAFEACGRFAAAHDIRTCFHPDQFVVLNSPHSDVVERSILELEYQCEVAQWVGADVVNIHGGGGYGDRPAALKRFAQTLPRLSDRVRERLTVENDDVTYTPEDLLPLCRAENIPLVYDVHHHRCLPDSLSIEQATDGALETWNREPLFHLSSPIEGWQGPKPRRHHEYIDITDFPECWRDRAITVEVEAKAKEQAVLRLQRQLAQRWTVYVLRCGDNTLYTGITNDMSRRLAQHNAGKASRYTRSRLPVRVLYQETHPHRSAALKRELAIKALSKAEKQRLIAEQKKAPNEPVCRK